MACHMPLLDTEKSTEPLVQTDLFCEGCNRVFHSKGTLDTHKLTCSMPLKPKKTTASFYVAWLSSNVTATGTNEEEQRDIEKILPLSQSDEMATTATTVVDQNAHLPPKPQCEYCLRTFTTERGLKTHQHSCMKKNKIRGEEGRTDTTQQAQQVPTVTQDSSQHDEPRRDDLGTILPRVWGNHTDTDLAQAANSMYEEIVFWRKNLFKLPSGAAGKRYIKETTRLIEVWNENSQPVSDISLKMAMNIPAILLQKPSKKSTSKQHTEYLNKRLDLWEEGKFDELMKESRAIQEKLKLNTSKFDSPEHTTKVFAKLMLQGKVNAALRLLDKKSSIGVAEVNEKTMDELKKLHPEAQEAHGSTLAQGDIPYFDPVIFTNIDEESIAKAALRTRGVAGPSGLDADGWRRILISKNYGKIGKDLRSAIAKMTQRLCTRVIPTETGNNSLEAYTACRLIPLEKEPSGIRPIGIGEVLRRIIGKAVVAEIKPEIMESAGSLQLCGGQKAGCEAAAHAMREIYEDEGTDAVLFVDASNAFNSLNRQALLHNIQYLCPQMATYIRNCYATPSRLFVAGGKELLSAEGTTQGDPLAMPAYGVGILPLLLQIKAGDPTLLHLAYADDIGAGSRLRNLREWWDRIVEHGPTIGYFPKPSKSWLVVKEEKLEEAKVIFEGTGIKICTEGRKYLGGFVGTKEGSEKYVGGLLKEWLEQLEELTKIAKSEPQAAYASFTAGFKHKVTYFMRTIPDLVEVLKPLDHYIDNFFIPAITEGHIVSKDDRKLLSLPVRLGGMGIPIFSETSKNEFRNSLKATELLRPNIIAQEQIYIQNRRAEHELDSSIRAEREKGHKDVLNDLRSRMSKDQIRGNDLAQMKGASAWLTSLPLKEEGYTLNKREFFDAITLRYRWDMKRLPTNCACGKKFDMDHAMSCMKGGYVHRRHDGLRDLFADLMDDVAHGVHTEPTLQPLSGEILPDGANSEEQARLDIAARGFWQDCEMAFFDVRVFHPFAKSHLNNNLESVFRSNENQKKRAYNNRVIQVEHGSFSPIVFSSFGGHGVETGRVVAKLIEKIAKKKDLEHSVVANYVRTKISFQLVRSQVTSIRGSRRMKKMAIDPAEMELVTTSAAINE